MDNDELRESFEMRSPQIILHGLISIAAACLNIAFSSNDVKAQYQGENERVWAASLQADISNGAAADDICRNASSSAVTSDDVNFKNWAYSVARQYCESGFEIEDGRQDQLVPENLSTASPECRLTVSQMNDVGRGIKTTVQANQ